MSILLSGSLAYDYILDVPDRFADHLLPDQLHILSVAFLVQRLEKSFGGTAGNIAYAMHCIGTHPTIVSAVGSDGQEYRKRLSDFGMTVESVLQDESVMTAAAHIMTDKDNNQITGFFPGPLEKIATLSLKGLASPGSLLLVSPNPVTVMKQHLLEAKELGLKAIFDPGQAMTLFSPEDLRQCVELAWCVLGNDYEMKLLGERTGWDQGEMQKRVELRITTLGAEGSLIQTSMGETIRTMACPANTCVDPTGAGDAFRAGFFVGYDQGKDLKTCAQIGSTLATYAVETFGTQLYSFTIDAFSERYLKTYGERLDLK